jgi:uncharacterized iron-regulated protein
LKGFFLCLLVVGSVLCTSACSGDNLRLLRIADGTEISLAEIVGDLAGVRLVFVGELHDEKKHHDAQLAVIQALNAAAVPLAVGLEMFQHTDQEALDRWTNGAYTEKEFKGFYDRNWTIPWELYRPIFSYARDRRIPLIGLNVPSEITRQVARQGFQSLTQEQLGRLPEVACRVDPIYMDFIREVFGMHGHSDKQFTYFCEAQMVWDTAMAVHLLSYLEKNPAHTIVVLAGNGHAWKRGIPEQVRQRAKATYRVILPQIPERINAGEATVEDADYLWLMP